MSRTKSTIFRPILGSTYTAINTKTKEKVTCRVLSLSDSDEYGPVRSGKSCKRGEEFFKVFIKDKMYKMNNSIDNGISLSEDKMWEFIDEKPLCGAKTAKIKKEKKVKKVSKPAKAQKNKDIEFISREALSKII
jgi:hypothetical protein